MRHYCARRMVEIGNPARLVIANRFKIFTYGVVWNILFSRFIADRRQSSVSSFSRFRHFARLVIILSTMRTHMRAISRPDNRRRRATTRTTDHAFFRNDTRDNHARYEKSYHTYQMNDILPTTKSDSDWHTDTYIYAYDDTCPGLRAIYIIVIIIITTHVYFTTRNIIIHYYTYRPPPPPARFTLDGTRNEILILWPPESAIGVGGCGEVEGGGHIKVRTPPFFIVPEKTRSRNLCHRFRVL